MEPMDSSTHVRDPAQGHDHTCTIIFLHGRDSEAQEFASELFESEASIVVAADSQDRTLPGMLPNVRWIFPSAPVLHSQRFDRDMSQWFDIWTVEEPQVKSEIQRSGLRQSMEALRAVIEAEEKLISKDRIFLCGISQGFATAVFLFLGKGQGGFAGLIGLCSWLPFSSEMEAISVLEQKATPIFLGHAVDDDVVPIRNGQRMRDILSNLGLHVEWREYQDGGHWVNEPQGVDDMISFIKANLG